MAEAKKRYSFFSEVSLYDFGLITAVSGAVLTYLVWHRSFMPNVTTGHAGDCRFLPAIGH
jgi:hypothetical protein